jgi:hypothetical protein
LPSAGLRLFTPHQLEGYSPVQKKAGFMFLGGCPGRSITRFMVEKNDIPDWRRNQLNSKKIS